MRFSTFRRLGAPFAAPWGGLIFSPHTSPRQSGSQRSMPLGHSATTHPGRAARHRRPSVYDLVTSSVRQCLFFKDRAVVGGGDVRATRGPNVSTRERNWLHTAQAPNSRQRRPLAVRSAFLSTMCANVSWGAATPTSSWKACGQATQPLPRQDVGRWEALGHMMGNECPTADLWFLQGFSTGTVPPWPVSSIPLPCPPPSCLVEARSGASSSGRKR